MQSLSARRAWIEIAGLHRKAIPPHVALRKESVDRNALITALAAIAAGVALRKESVDRNGIVAHLLA